METTISITRYDIKTHNQLDDFEDLIHNLRFNYHSDHLALIGLSPAEIHDAITCAMKVCKLNGVEATEHFALQYVFDEKEHSTYGDWKMTRQGFILSILNAPKTNEAIARWQWELVNVMMEQENGESIF